MLVRVASSFFALLTVVANLATVGAVVLYMRRSRSEPTRRLLTDIRGFLATYGLALAWCVATVSVLGSLFYSEVAGYIPCKLCWYQRIAMYPQAAILGLAALRRDTRAKVYALLLCAIGASISIYHYLLQRFPEIGGGGSCDPAAPCTLTWVWQFHYISIPFMALSGFALIAAILLLTPSDDLERKDVQT